jgi:hypothetical protein
MTNHIYVWAHSEIADFCPNGTHFEPEYSSNSIRINEYRKTRQLSLSGDENEQRKSSKIEIKLGLKAQKEAPNILAQSFIHYFEPLSLKPFKLWVFKSGKSLLRSTWKKMDERKGDCIWRATNIHTTQVGFICSWRGVRISWEQLTVSFLFLPRLGGGGHSHFGSGMYIRAAF